MASQTPRIGLLDGFAIELPDADVDAPSLPPGVQRLIAQVTLAGRPGRGATAGQLWPDESEGSAQSRLRSALWRLHKATPGLVEASSGSLRLVNGVTVDVHELTNWARVILDSDCDLESVRIPDVALRGELLPGWYDDWILLERERLRQLRLHALEVLADKLAIVGRYGEAMEAAIGAVQGEPFRESAHRAVIRVHLAEGNMVEAVREYTGFRQMIDAELGVKPTVHMEELMRGVRIPQQGRLVR